MINQVHQLLREVGPGKMSSLAYDTAWVARLGEVSPSLSEKALDWLCENQLPDGSWGAEKPFHYHDRFVSTLAALLALTDHGRRSKYKAQIETGVLALEKISAVRNQGYIKNSYGRTVGFEMITPALAAEARKLGILRRDTTRILDPLSVQRKEKMDLLKGKTIDRHLTAAFSAEMVGKDGQHIVDVENLQESNGSVGHSPSATAYFALYLHPGEHNALSYLNEVTDEKGGAPDLLPFDVYETSWVLWNLLLVEEWDNETRRLFIPLVKKLKSGWKPDTGIGFSVSYSVPDGDNTAFVYEVLSRFGESINIKPLLTFEKPGHFRTYHFESHSSNSVNIHALGALRYTGSLPESPVIKKILNYLDTTRVSGAYWFDKWNLSPYYTTAHAIIACSGFVNQFIEPSVEWLIRTQREDGSWGIQFPTAEETAYALQALTIWKRHGGILPKETIQKAADWLQIHMNPPYPPLWIGKGLYTPELVTKSAILSALLLSENG